MKRILLMATAREKSTRVQNKMLRPFGNTTLFQLHLNLLEEIQEKNNPFSNIFIALNQKDKHLYDIAKQSKIKIQSRSDFSAGDATLPADVYHYLENYDEEYVVWINACFPLLKSKTVIDITNFFVNSEHNSLHCVSKRENWFWNMKTNNPLNLENTSDTATQQSLPIYESVHCCLMHKVSDLLDKNRLWTFTKGDPYLFKLQPSIEFLDIDNQTEFDTCEAVYKEVNK